MFQFTKNEHWSDINNIENKTDKPAKKSLPVEFVDLSGLNNSFHAQSSFYSADTSTCKATVKDSTVDANGNKTVDPNGNKIISYGQSAVWQKYLDYSQGDNSYKFLSDCGLVACENVLIQEGVLPEKINYNPSFNISTFTYKQYNDSDESIVVNYAVKNKLCEVISNDPTDSGGTYPSWQINILAGFGVSAKEMDPSKFQGINFSKIASCYKNIGTAYVNAIANAIKNNKCVIADIDADILWNNKRDPNNYEGHAVTVTGVAYKANSNAIDGFYICDSGMGMIAGIKDAAEFISVDTMTKLFNCYLDTTTYTVKGKTYTYSYYDLWGDAIVTDNSKETLDPNTGLPVNKFASSGKTMSAAAITSGVKSGSFSSDDFLLSDASVNSVIHHMAAFSGNADKQVLTSFDNDNQNQNLATLVASHFS